MDVLKIQRENIEQILAEDANIQYHWNVQCEDTPTILQNHESMAQRYAPATRTPMMFNISSVDDLYLGTHRNTDTASNVNNLIQQFETQLKIARFFQKVLH